MTDHTRYVPSPPDEKIIRDFIVSALHEDCSHPYSPEYCGDHTSLSTIPASVRDKARLLVKDEGVLAGVELAKFIFREVDPSISVTIFKNDGERIRRGDIVLEAEGPSRALLTAERVMLNCMQRMSGIATHTDKLVQLLSGLHTQVIDTRKTTPGFRYFEKWAVRIGGGANHRFGLFDMILIKDNHVDYAGGVRQAIEAAKKYRSEKNLDLDIEVEVRNMNELAEAMATGGIRRIMLDNFSPEQLKEAVQTIGGKFESEASGGITEATIRSYAETGVDYISVGALTHHVRSLDLSFKAVK